ncbi:MAG: hypothetical protein UU13_C0025G0006 [Candidatus Nomurabacteria bacterium GW2011_GWB1_40_7]|uniref:Uncharacterized protein n=1 Tax=Candidatus Nomurabacteria bacterium GW2011_GWB1_40_7 TaxID=1618744 RepID=A0A0G0T4N9_9BACT|nr:MAG: hypothetical protein UU13_C0025G0006 [Candidatus Nomurabacteria bacterium GW2011_GWB1_40_7]
MDIKDLNKSQLILLAILLSFVTSIATGITTVTLMQQAPASVTMPVTRIVRETVEKIVPVESKPKTQALSAEEKKLLEDLKAIKPLTVTLFLKGLPAQSGETEDKILGTGLFLGDNKVVIASIIAEPKEGEVYMVKSVLGEQKVSKVTAEEDFTIIELVVAEEPILAPGEDTAPPDGAL